MIDGSPKVAALRLPPSGRPKPNGAIIQSSRAGGQTGIDITDSQMSAPTH